MISAGYRHTCAVTTSGGAKCWGQNLNGQIGDGSTTQRNAPVDVSGLTSGVAAVEPGGNHTCARLTSGAVKCWGLNDQGQLGDGTTTQQTTPVSVSSITSGALSLAMGYAHSCATVTGGGLKCWGSNSNKQLSDPTVLYSTTPLVVSFSNYTYTYGDTAHKHAVTALSTGESYTYDANGNMITRVEGGSTYTQTFDAENRLITVAVSGQTTSFVYDGDGNLVKKINPDGTKTLYVAGIYEVDKNSGGTVIGTKTYYPAGSAMRIGSTLYYVLKDHLGSSSVVTDASGNTVGEDRFYPFGQTRLTTGTMLTDKLFTGQRQITGLGIYDYGARFYSPYINRFLSADTIVPGYANPQSLNRYSYVNNNPLRYVDPTGHMFDDGCSLGCSYTPPPPVNYCTTHPGACGNNNNNNGNNNQTSVSNSTVSIPVGVSSSYSPNTSSYAEQAEEGSCGGCSMEPVEAPNPFDIFNFAGQWGLNYLAVNSQDIAVYVNMTPNANGSVSVQSITVDNTHTGINVAVVQVSFETSGDTSACFSPSGSCVTNAPYGYSVQSQPGIYSSDLVMPGIGAVTQPNSMQVVALTPSGNPNNQTNTFTHNFEIRVVLGDSLTGNVYNPISTSIHP